MIEVVSFVLGLSGMLGLARVASAEPLLVSIEGQGAVAVTTPQSDQFGPGFNAALAVRYPLGAWLQIGVEARAGLLSAGEEAFDLGQAEPRPGSYELGMLMVRLKPLATIDGMAPRRAAGLFIDVGGGGGVTGKEARVGFQGGLGFGFGLGGGITIAPTVRYLQVIQPADPLSSRDARLMLFGLELSAFDARPRVHHAMPEPAKPAPPPPAAVAIADHDHDGVDDPSDACPEAAEDDDEFEDADGCPELDNDRDGVADTQDACPDAPEDLDGNRDADGCPDVDDDRDHDHIFDTNDKCPDEPEVINGKDDEDGCPDEGLIALEDDRIVLDSRVLFDAGAARVRHAAWASLDAIVELKKQHPEWVKIRIEGHADARGSAALNQSLSERRARNAMKHLIKIGVPAEQLESIGYGSSRPRDPGTGEEANRRNRRVEFVVVRGDAEEVSEPPKPPPAPAKPSAPESAKPPAPAKPKAPESANTAPKREAVTLPEFTIDAPAPPASSVAPAKPAEPPKVPALPPAPAKPTAKPGEPAPPAPTKSGLTPSGLRPIPAEKK